MQEFDTLSPEHIIVANNPELLTPERMNKLPVQALALPWITRAGVILAITGGETDEDDPIKVIESAVRDWSSDALSKTDPNLPTILTAHASVSGAKFGNEQEIKIGRDVVLPLGLVTDTRFDYVALGHIHRHQDLNPGSHPPVVYPGSIERVDFGEVNEEKGFIIAQIDKGKTTYEWRKLPIRKFIARSLPLEDEHDVNEKILESLPTQEEMEDAVVRLKVTFPQGYEVLIDDARIHSFAKGAFEFKLVKDPLAQVRSRLPGGQETSSMTPLELLDLFWKEKNEGEDERRLLSDLAQDLISQLHCGDDS